MLDETQKNNHEVKWFLISFLFGLFDGQVALIEEECINYKKNYPKELQKYMK